MFCPCEQIVARFAGVNGRFEGKKKGRPVKDGLLQKMLGKLCFCRSFRFDLCFRGLFFPLVVSIAAFTLFAFVMLFSHKFSF
jgi:hypothetical protein